MNKRILTTLLVVLLHAAQAFSLSQAGNFISSDQFSSGLINSMCQDHMGAIWVATDYGVSRYDGYFFHTFLHDDDDSLSVTSNAVDNLFCDSKGRLWLGTNKGLDRFDAERFIFEHFPFPGNITPRVASIAERSDGTLLVGTAGYGVYKLNGSGRLEHFSLETSGDFYSKIYEDSRGNLWGTGFDEKIYLRRGNVVTAFRSQAGAPQGITELDGRLLVICQHGFMTYENSQMKVSDIDLSAIAGREVVFTSFGKSNDGNIYIGTRGQGLYRISEERPRRLEPVSVSVFGLNVSTAKISTIMFDRKNNLWAGCHGKGLLQVSQRPMQFSTWSFTSQGIQLGSSVSSVCEGDDGMVWCTVQGVGVYGFNRQGRVVAHPQTPDAVEFIFRDRQRRYWLGSDDGLYAYDPLTGHSQLKVSFDCDKFNDMTSDDQGNIYLSTFSKGFCIYNPETGSLRNYNMYSRDSRRGTLCNDWIMGMSSDRSGKVWMATASGVACFDPKTQSFLSQGWKQLLNGTLCFDVCELRSGKLPDGRSLSGCVAIGTEHGLYLYDRSKRQVERFPGSEQLSNMSVCYIVQSNDGDVWCSSSEGIWQYSLTTGKFIDHVNGNGLLHKEYIYGVGMHTDEDQIFFGHNDGLTTFTPKNVVNSEADIDPLQLVAFRVGNQYVYAGTVINGVEVTDRDIPQSNYFVVSYLDHTVTLAFSQFSFDNPLNVNLEYRVNEGAWVVQPKGRNEFTLGHLQPGSYRIEVRAQVGEGYTPVKVVVITVRAPWYRSLTAYFIYFLLIAALAVMAFLGWRRKANRQLNEEKMKFLINATHDIRSPLTLILGALKKLKATLSSTEATDGEATDHRTRLSAETSSEAMDTIDRNAQRILNLVNQILDVRKIDKQQMQLHCQPTDLVAFTSGICKMFDFNAKERGIDFTFDHGDMEHLEAWVDIGQFDKVITNLLSNAFKYTADGGQVRVSLATIATDDGQQPNRLRIEVSDSGVGLDSESLKHIFDRFYQGSQSRHLRTAGTGIGLNLCKMIVDMHHGTITAANRSDGTKGAVFTVELPLGSDHLKADEKEAPILPLDGEATTGAPSQAFRGSRSGFRVLVVDDDPEIGRYISTELSHYYKLNVASNGKEALKVLLSEDYDVVVSDVMMPEMDGFTMLRLIKTNLNLSHIPVIMLTSKADVGNRLEGLERGADAFLAKPFDMDELHLTIENLIQTRQRLKGKFTGAQQQSDKIEQLEVKGNDEQLMERIMKAINKNLSDSDFNVEMLTQEVGISRAQLHRKMKELTGISTSEFIRNIRLEQAARLLKEQKINVTQVAYTVGFSNLAHFSTIFRKHFGVAPSEYAEREKED